MAKSQKIIGTSLILLGMLFLSGCTQKETAKNQNQTEIASTERSQSNQEIQNQVKNEEESAMETSLKELMNLGKSLKCHWELSDQEEGSIGKGTIYLSGKKFRQEITIGTVGENLAGGKFFSISDGEWVYNWNSIEKQGVKVQLSEMEKMAKQNQNQEQNQMNQPNQQLNLEEKFQYQCEDWNVDENLFIPDQEIQFMDMGEMTWQAQQMQKNLQQGGSGLGNVCNVCQQLPSQQKEECLKSCDQ